MTPTEPCRDHLAAPEEPRFVVVGRDVAGDEAEATGNQNWHDATSGSTEMPRDDRHYRLVTAGVSRARGWRCAA
ncbi:MAG: hypothetical protein ABI468_00110 [Candidatus Nanopelagicales bacterium]